MSGDAGMVRGERAVKRGLVIAVVIGGSVLALAMCVVIGAGVMLFVIGNAYEDASEFSSDDPSRDEAADVRTLLGRDLPPSARNVRYAYSHGIDHVGVLRAEIPAADFAVLTSDLSMTPWHRDRTFTDNDTWLDFSVFPMAPRAAWWTPPTDIDESVHVHQRGSSWLFARHDGATMWLGTLSH